MKVLLSASIFATVAMLVATAPTLADNDASATMNEQQQDFFRDKRSKYGVQYISPCAAAAASAPMPAYAPAAAYHYDVAPMHGGYAVPHYGYGGPHYRSIDPIEAEQEILGFSDMDHVMSEHVPMARYGGYGVVPAAVHAGMAGSMAAPAAAAPTPAFGVFPNANVGGCSVPLLLSCSPSIVRGQIVKAQPNYGYSSSGDSYRVVDDHHAEATDGHHDELVSHDHSNAAVQDPSHALHQ